MNNPLLQQAITELGKLPPEDQQAITVRWLESNKTELAREVFGPE